jgi:hypothetical protein
MHRWIAAAAASGLLLLAGCGSDDDKSTAAAPVTAASSQPSSVAATYKPVSDVSSNGAIGKDVVAIRALLEPEQAGAKPDFAAAAKIWSEGKFSKSSDGSNRTLAGWVEKETVATRVKHALSGSGTAAGLSQAARVETIDKGMIVSLKVHALSEFDGAKEKLAKGELDPEEGAAHNVDEVWAYFNAEGEGVIATAAKRAKDFGLGEHDLGNAVIAGITAAQQAVKDEDAAALEAAAQETRGAMNRIFALAVKKYAVEGAKDATARAEGLAFSWGLEGQLDDGDLKTIQAAFGPQAGDDAATTVAETLDGAVGDLGTAGPLPAYPPVKP